MEDETLHWKSCLLEKWNRRCREDMLDHPCGGWWVLLGVCTTWVVTLCSHDYCTISQEPRVCRSPAGNILSCCKLLKVCSVYTGACSGPWCPLAWRPWRWAVGWRMTVLAEFPLVWVSLYTAKQWQLQQSTAWNGTRYVLQPQHLLIIFLISVSEFRLLMH